MTACRYTTYPMEDCSCCDGFYRDGKWVVKSALDRARSRRASAGLRGVLPPMPEDWAPAARFNVHYARCAEAPTDEHTIITPEYFSAIMIKAIYYHDKYASIVGPAYGVDDWLQELLIETIHLNDDEDEINWDMHAIRLVERWSTTHSGSAGALCLDRELKSGELSERTDAAIAVLKPSVQKRLRAAIESGDWSTHNYGIHRAVETLRRAMGCSWKNTSTVECKDLESLSMAEDEYPSLWFDPSEKDENGQTFWDRIAEQGSKSRKYAMHVRQACEDHGWDVPEWAVSKE